jgi:hypothetical protein
VEILVSRSFGGALAQVRGLGTGVGPLEMDHAARRYSKGSKGGDKSPHSKGSFDKALPETRPSRILPWPDTPNAEVNSHEGVAPDAGFAPDQR